MFIYIYIYAYVIIFTLLDIARLPEGDNDTNRRTTNVSTNIKIKNKIKTISLLFAFH